MVKKRVALAIIFTLFLTFSLVRAQLDMDNNFFVEKDDEYEWNFIIDTLYL